MRFYPAGKTQKFNNELKLRECYKQERVWALYPNGMFYNLIAEFVALMRTLAGNQPAYAILQGIKQLRRPAVGTKRRHTNREPERITDQAET